MLFSKSSSFRPLYFSSSLLRESIVSCCFLIVSPRSRSFSLCFANLCAMRSSCVYLRFGGVLSCFCSDFSVVFSLDLTSSWGCSEGLSSSFFSSTFGSSVLTGSSFFSSTSVWTVEVSAPWASGCLSSDCCVVCSEDCPDASASDNLRLLVLRP